MSQCAVDLTDTCRVTCISEFNEDKCITNGCCWQTGESGPNCFYSNYEGIVHIIHSRSVSSFYYVALYTITIHLHSIIMHCFLHYFIFVLESGFMLRNKGCADGATLLLEVDNSRHGWALLCLSHSDCVAFAYHSTLPADVCKLYSTICKDATIIRIEAISTGSTKYFLLYVSNIHMTKVT